MSYRKEFGKYAFLNASFIKKLRISTKRVLITSQRKKTILGSITNPKSKLSNDNPMHYGTCPLDNAHKKAYNNH